MSTRMFGTDGVRGVPGTPPLDADTIVRLGAAIVAELRAAPDGPLTPRIVCGRDTRDSGAWIQRQLAVGVREGGGELLSVGVAPTPGVAMLTARGGFDAGLAVSASHNPYPDNGIKLITATGAKATRDVEQQIEARLGRDGKPPGIGSAPGAVTEAAHLVATYVEHLADIAGAAPLNGMRVAIDCAHGATSRLAPEVLGRLGADVVTLHAAPDGRNINQASGSTHPEALQAEVVRQACAVGFAFDGDGDRVIAVDAAGRLVDGDGILYLVARALRDAARLPHDGIVATVMSNYGLESALRDAGITLHRCGVGDSTVYAEMQRRSLSLGGEQSGHVIFSDLLPTGDGIATAIRVLRILAEQEVGLAELVDGLTILPQVLVNVPVTRMPPIAAVPELNAAVGRAEAQLAGSGRVLVRYSGTESLLRVMIEGRDREAVRALASGIAQQARESLAAGGEIRRHTESGETPG
ncbi:MAG: phosphoglucosamine mutase [Acidobacteria bacterium]|nr:phosphoglucosamine mutase [Acidobacteriota bacterium]